MYLTVTIADVSMSLTLLLPLFCLVWFLRGLRLGDVLPNHRHDDNVIVDPHSDDQDYQSKGLAN